MKRQFRICLIGRAWITDSLLAAFRHNGNYSYIAIYSRSQKDAENYQRKNFLNEAISDFDKITKDKFDIVYVASRTFVHFSQIKLLIEKKLHIFSEKPLVKKLKHFNILYDLAIKNKIILFEGYKTVYMPIHKYLKDGLKEIGKINNIVISGAKPPNSLIWNKKKKCWKDNRDFYDYIYYFIALGIELFGKINLSSIKCVWSTLGYEKNTYMAANVKYKCGIDGLLIANFGTQKNLSTVFYGTNGEIILESPTNNISLEIIKRNANKVKKYYNEWKIKDTEYYFEVDYFTKMIINKNNKKANEILQHRTREIVSVIEKINQLEKNNL